jgi:hypothetical protein
MRSVHFHPRVNCQTLGAVNFCEHGHPNLCENAAFAGQACKTASHVRVDGML